MKITFKLYASLAQHLPPEAAGGNAVQIDIAPQSTIADIIAPFHLPMKLVHLVLINGVYVGPEDRATRTLNEGDVLAIWPPIAGG
ncbi:MAG: MoaD/ThiS family protein [Betaproteobacteria bacterium]|jgi:sulfur carrier protein ThiS|nr:MoaD/ThiS family protein [Betaproteobacteria bacterium]NBT10654.1 MoaD/ThiS family protein [Betaproteobacteria bacterium]NBU48571.1 MoaD/ThiS family protein [Betaproteobacteria bacterium]NBX96800.1 MoaD/ThiS family protein [Betaproteobacteria bacterium]